jgi:hypothetical protein
MALPTQICFSSSPFGVTPNLDFAQIGTVNPLPDGTHFTLTWAPTVNGLVPVTPTTVLSVQPTGLYETRPAGTQGAYESLIIQDGCLVVRPNWDTATQAPIFPAPVPTIAYVIPFKVLA